MNTQAIFAPIDNTKIRMTDEGKLAVIDMISETTGYNNDYSGKILRRIKSDSEAVRTSLSEHKFPGERQRPTPVADRETVINILQLLPGIAGDKFRAAVAKLVLGFLDADINIAESIVQRNTNPKELQRLAIRAQGKATRNEYTSTLARHGVRGEGFSKCTDAINTPILGNKAAVVKKELNLPQTANLRDHLPTKSLVAIMFAEEGATGIIEAKQAFGNAECELLSGKAASIVANAMQQFQALAG